MSRIEQDNEFHSYTGANFNSSIVLGGVNGLQYASLRQPIYIRWDLGPATSLATTPFDLISLSWREQGTRYHPANVRERGSYGGGGVMFWDDITINGSTLLHVFDGSSMTAYRYRQEILEAYG